VGLSDETRFGAPRKPRFGRLVRLRWSVSVVLVAMLVLGAAVVAAPPAQAAYPQAGTGSSANGGADGDAASAAPAAQVEATEGASPSATPTPEERPEAKASAEPNSSTTPTTRPSSDEASAPKASVTPNSSTSPAAPSSTTTTSSAAADSASRPTITSDLADYPPGGTVTLTGTGWQPGEVVTIVVNDTGGLTWNLEQDVVADSDGGITLTFNLPDRYVPDYDVTATGTVSGVARTTFTDAANGVWRYWISTVTPANSSQVTPSSTISYTLNAQRVSGGTTSGGITTVSGAVVTFSVGTSPATITSVAITGTGGVNGTTTPTANTPMPAGTTSLTWQNMTLSGTTTRSITVTVTVNSAASAGATVGATVSDGGDPNGSYYTSTDGSRLETTTHTVYVPGSCDFADSGSGTYANSICWFEMSGYNATTAKTGQKMTQTLPNGYTLSYTITATGSTVAAVALPTYSGSYMGVGGYTGIVGYPALYQTSGATTSTLTLSNITLTDSSGASVTSFALIGADAESTDGSVETITWTSEGATLTSIGTLGNSCGGGFSVSTMTVKCTGGASGNKNGMPILYSQNPTTLTQSLTTSGGLQGVAFGITVAGIQLKKAVVNPVTPTDSFAISVTPTSGGSALGSATANSASSWAADTGKLYWYAPGTSQTLTMSETSASAANYAVSWACTRNGTAFTPTNPTGTSNTVSLAFGDFVVCTITNTGIAPTIVLRKTTTGATGGPFNFTLTNTTVTSGSVSTSTVGAPAKVGTFTVSAFGTDVKITEASQTGWQLSSATCVNASGVSVGTSSGSVFTIGQSFLVARAVITCDFTNAAIMPTVLLQKTTTGATGGPFNFTLTNTAVTSGSVSTSTVGAPAKVGTFTVSAVNTAVTITEAALAGWQLSSVTCVNASGSSVGGLTGSVFTIQPTYVVPGAAITCTYTNAAILGTATWSKVDAGSPSTLLAGSEWTLTGPSYPSGTTVVDCVAASASLCTGLDANPSAGAFAAAKLRYGSYTLVEKTAPVGFQLDTTSHGFSIDTDGQTVNIGAITNTRSVVPSLPLTGGTSTDAFLLSGTALLAVAGIGGWLHRRRSLRSL
jgi:LPXTG-motif cell wall-anchored protein